MKIITFRFWPDERESYRAQLADIERVYFETKFDQEGLNELFQLNSLVDFADIEVKSHLYTHILILAQQWQFQVQFQVHTYLQENLKQQQLPANGLYFHTVIRRFATAILSTEMAQKLDVAKMQQLYYLAEVIKSGSVTAVKRLQHLRPEFFVNTDPAASSADHAHGSTPHIDVFASIYRSQAALRISELDFLDFVSATEHFWLNAPETLEVERELVRAMLR